MVVITTVFNIFLLIIKIVITIYLRMVVSLLLFVFFLAQIEAFKIFNKPALKLGCGRFLNESLYPETIISVDGGTQISELLYKKYKLLVFNIIYHRVISGGWARQIGIVTITTSMLYYILGISKVLLSTVSILFSYRKYTDMSSVLLDMFGHASDNRKLIRIGGVWVANGKVDYRNNLIKYISSCGNGRFSLDNVSKTQLLEISEYFQSINNTKYTMVYFKDIFGGNIPHKGFVEATNNKDFIGLETDYHKSVFKNFYNKQVLIVQYNNQKDSTLLYQKLTELQPIKEVKSIILPEQILGLHRYGGNLKLLSQQYLNQYEVYGTGLKQIDDFIINHNLTNADRYKIAEYINKCSFFTVEDFD